MFFFSDTEKRFISTAGIAEAAMSRAWVTTDAG